MTVTKATTGDVLAVFNKSLPALVALAAAAAVTVVISKYQAFTSFHFLFFTMFIFPVPVAMGFAAAVLSPRRSLVRAPLWACVFSILYFSMIFGAIHVPIPSGFPWHGVYPIAGAIISGLSAIATKSANRITRIHIASAFALLCILYGTLGLHMNIKHRSADFETNVMPEILMTVDSDYIRLPSDLKWVTSIDENKRFYKMESSLNDDPIIVLADPALGKLSGVSYKFSPTKQHITDIKTARRYLTDVGVRGKILKSLAPDGSDGNSWRSGLENTQLTLNDRGNLRLSPIICDTCPVSSRCE